MNLSKEDEKMVKWGTIVEQIASSVHSFAKSAIEKDLNRCNPRVCIAPDLMVPPDALPVQSESTEHLGFEILLFTMGLETWKEGLFMLASHIRQHVHENGIYERTNSHTEIRKSSCEISFWFGNADAPPPLINIE
jgi:hypothetical protein